MLALSSGSNGLGECNLHIFPSAFGGSILKF